MLKLNYAIYYFESAFLCRHINNPSLYDYSLFVSKDLYSSITLSSFQIYVTVPMSGDIFCTNVFIKKPDKKWKRQMLEWLSAECLAAMDAMQGLLKEGHGHQTTVCKCSMCCVGSFLLLTVTRFSFHTWFVELRGVWGVPYGDPYCHPLYCKSRESGLSLPEYTTIVLRKTRDSWWATTWRGSWARWTRSSSAPSARPCWRTPAGGQTQSE